MHCSHDFVPLKRRIGSNVTNQHGDVKTTATATVKHLQMAVNVVDVFTSNRINTVEFHEKSI